MDKLHIPTPTDLNTSFFAEKSAWALVFETFIYLFEAKLFRKRFLVFRNKMNNEGFKITVKVLRATIVFSVILVFFDVTAKLFGMRFSKKEVIHVATGEYIRTSCE